MFDAIVCERILCEVSPLDEILNVSKMFINKMPYQLVCTTEYVSLYHV